MRKKTRFAKKGFAALCATAVMGSAQAYELALDKWNTNLPPIDVHGFASQGVLYSGGYNYLGQSKDGSIKFTEMGLNASFNPFPRTRIAVQGFDYSVGNVGQYNVLLDYALAEYTVNDKLGFRGGRIRRPSGIYNHIQDVDLARTSVLLPQGMYDARWRDFSGTLDGGEIFGSTPIPKAGSLSYEGYFGYVNMSDNGGVARSVQNGLPVGGNLDSIGQSKIFGGQLWWNTPLDGLRIGGSGGYLKDFGYFITLPTGAPPGMGFPLTYQAHNLGDIPFQQYSIEYIWKDWTFQAEYYTYNFSGHTYVGGASVANANSNPDSWYVSANYRFNKWLQSGTYYTEYYGSVHNRGDSSQYQKDLALSFRFDIKDWWIFKVEGHYIHGTGLLNDNAHNPVQNNNGWFMIAAKTTLSF